MFISEKHIYTVTQSLEGRGFIEELIQALEDAEYHVSRAESTTGITVVATRHVLRDGDGRRS